jgi:hypothetical protein
MAPFEIDPGREGVRTQRALASQQS